MYFSLWKLQPHSFAQLPYSPITYLYCQWIYGNPTHSILPGGVKQNWRQDWKLSVSLRQGRFAECLLTWKQPSRWFVIIVQLQRQQGYIYWTDSWWALRCVLRTQLSQASLCYLVTLYCQWIYGNPTHSILPGGVKQNWRQDWKLSVSLRQGRFAECLLTWKQPSRWFVIIVQLQRQQGYIYWTDSWWALRCVLRTQLSQASLCYLVDLSVWVKEDYKIVSVAT